MDRLRRAVEGAVLAQGDEMLELAGIHRRLRRMMHNAHRFDENYALE
jgi:hypothetical protein